MQPFINSKDLTIFETGCPRSEPYFAAWPKVGGILRAPLALEEPDTLPFKIMPSDLMSAM